MSFLYQSVMQRNVVLFRQIVQRSSSLRSQRFTTASSNTDLFQKNILTNLVTKRSLSATGDHSKIWVIEKALSAALIGVIPAAFLCQSTILDNLLALSLIAHCHWGLEAIVIDYIRPTICGPVIPKIAVASMYLLSFAALAGLFYLNYSDVGLSTSIKMMAKA